jgi:hypothetical protein
LPRFGDIYSHSPSIHLPASACIPAAFCTFFKLFDLPASSVTFAFPQFASFRSFFDHPSLCATAFYDEEQIANGDQMDDEEQIGLISSDIILTKKS